jgi:small subunit ribosomal protein S5
MFGVGLLNSRGGRFLTSAASARTFASRANNNSNNNNNKTSFKPRNRVKTMTPKKKKKEDVSPGNDHKFVKLGNVANPRDQLESMYGMMGGEAIREFRKDLSKNLSYDEHVEEKLRMADYFIATPGSTEDLVGERRALADLKPEELEYFKEWTQKFITDQSIIDFDPDDTEYMPTREKDDDIMQEFLQDQAATTEVEKDDEDPDDVQASWDNIQPNQKVFGEWSELLVDVDRNVKLWRGGRLESYRALVVGGNMNGVGGFGVGKGDNPSSCVVAASRICKRNIFFLNRYQGDSITTDLVGKQNACKVTIRTSARMKGNYLMREICARFGVVNVDCKSYGRRTPYNVVRATFKALQAHEGIEDIAMKRGKRLVSIDRARRMQV